MALQKTGGNGFTRNGTAGSAADPFPDATAFTDDGLRLYVGVYSGDIDNVSFTQPWIINRLATVADSRRILAASRIRAPGQDASLYHSWGGSLSLVTSAALYVSGQDPDYPIDQATAIGTTGNNRTITGPSLTPTRDGSIVACLWAAHYTSGASSRALSQPTAGGFASWLTSGNPGLVTSGSASGLNIAYAWRYADAGETVQQNVIAPSATGLAATMAFGVVINPPPPPPTVPTTTLVEDFEDTTYVAPISGAWNRDTSRAHTGSYAMQSVSPGNYGTADLQVTLPPGCISLSYWYTVSSESGYDFFRVLVDGVERLGTAASGEVGWTQNTIGSLEGATTVTFRYDKDQSVAAGADAAWIDDLMFTVPAPAGPEPGRFLLTV